MLSSRVVLVRDECEEEKEKSLSVFQEEGSAGLCTRVHRMEMLFGKTAKQSVFVSVFRRRKSDTLTQTHTPTHQILCPFINSMACREHHVSFSLFYDTTKNINTNPLLTLTHTHTSKYCRLQFSDGWRSNRSSLEHKISTRCRGLKGKKMKERSIWRVRKRPAGEEAGRRTVLIKWWETFRTECH